MISLKLIELRVQPACFFGRYLSAMRGLLSAELSPESRSGPQTRASLGLCASLKGDMELYIRIRISISLHISSRLEAPQRRKCTSIMGN